MHDVLNYEEIKREWERQSGPLIDEMLHSLIFKWKLADWLAYWGLPDGT